MLRLVGVIGLLVASCMAVPRKENLRIVGGRDTTIESHPYQVSLRRQGSHSCGGAILNANTILTAAHCVYYPDLISTDFQIRAGSTFRNEGGELRAISTIVTHPDYNDWTLEYDIAVLRVGLNLNFGDTIQPISLPSSTLTLADDTPATIAGWGTIYYQGPSTNRLQQVSVPIVNNVRCGLAYQNFAPVLPFHICAGSVGKDACQGDSGGPLVYQDQVIGVVSWGYGCAFENYPSVYTRVSEFIDFIATRM